MSKAALFEAVAPVVGLTAGAAIGKALGKRKVKKMMSKGLINRLRFSLDPGLKREIINKHIGVGTSVGIAGPAAHSTVKYIKQVLDTLKYHKGDIMGGSKIVKRAPRDVDDLLKLSAMRDEMSKIASAMHAYRAKHAFALGGASTQAIDTKPIDVKAAAKQVKITSNAGAPRGPRGPQKPTQKPINIEGLRADPLNPPPKTNA